jgi:hypothetical protein
MSDPIVYESATPRFDLPYLYAGQSQREVFVNEAFAAVDALLHPAIEGVGNVAPASPVAGESWVVGAAPTGAWAGRPGALATWRGSDWNFAGPRDGMRVIDRQTGQDLRFRGSWIGAATPDLPTGGATIDAEARVTIMQLIEALKSAGIFSED